MDELDINLVGPEQFSAKLSESMKGRLIDSELSRRLKNRTIAAAVLGLLIGGVFYMSTYIYSSSLSKDLESAHVAYELANKEAIARMERQAEPIKK